MEVSLVLTEEARRRFDRLDRVNNDEARRVAEDLVAQPGPEGALYRQLYELASIIRDAATDVAGAVEGIAWELDKAKRGPLAAARRQDSMSVVQDVQSLLGDNLLNDADKAAVRAELLKQLGAVDAPSPVAAAAPHKRPAKVRKVRR